MGTTSLRFRRMWHMKVVNTNAQHVEPTDAQLLAQSENRPDAFGELCGRHALALERWMFRATGDPQVAHDLTAETFAQAWFSRHRFAPQGDGSAAPWLFGIGKNLVRRYHRRNRTDTKARERLGMSLREVPDEEYTEIEEHLDAMRLSPHIATAMAELPLREQRAVTMRIVDDQPYSVVAAELGCSPAAARTYVSRALRKLSVRITGGDDA